MAENQTSAVKKVPVRIVHSEGVSEKESCAFLQQSNPPAAEPVGPGVAALCSLGPAGQDSVFYAFTRQKEADGIPAAHMNPKPQRDAYISTVRDPIVSNSQQPPQTSYEPGSNDAVAARGVSEDKEREDLARDIMGKDKSLADILDQSKMKTTMDMMEGIFPQGDQLLDVAHQRRKAPPKQTGPQPAEERSASSIFNHTGPDRCQCFLYLESAGVLYVPLNRVRSTAQTQQTSFGEESVLKTHFCSTCVNVRPSVSGLSVSTYILSLVLHFNIICGGHKI